MKVFISSLIKGYEAYREAASAAARALCLEVIRAENFGARPETPRQACLAEVRDSDVLVLVLGAAYGHVQDSGLSATHEEWREAVREHKQVLVFVENTEDRELKQEAFLSEVESWFAGRLRDSFDSPEELQEKITQALFHLITSQGNVDVSEIRGRAKAALSIQRNIHSVRNALSVAVAAGPRRKIIRPSRIEDQQLGSDLQQRAMFEQKVLDQRAETRHKVVRDRLIIEQDRAMICLDEFGTLLIRQSVVREVDIHPAALPAIIEEDVQKL